MVVRVVVVEKEEGGHMVMPCLDAGHRASRDEERTSVGDLDRHKVIFGVLAVDKDMVREGK